MFIEHIGLGFGSGIAGTAIFSFVLLLYVIFDVIVSDEMVLLEKFIWIVLAGTTGFIGIVLYLYLIKYENVYIADHAEIESLQSGFTGSNIGELERLSRLKEKGDLTEEEFEQKKSEILEREEYRE